MATESPDPSPSGRRVELKEDYIDAAWKERWMSSKARYPEELIDNVGKVRGLFTSPDAPSVEDQVFLVCRTDPHAAGEIDVAEAYSTVSAANEHVLLLFAKAYGDAMDLECSWSMKGVDSGRELPPGNTHIVWSFSAHGCLSLEATLADDNAPGPHRVSIVEKWIETEPPEQLVKRILG